MSSGRLKQFIFMKNSKDLYYILRKKIAKIYKNKIFFNFINISKNVNDYIFSQLSLQKVKSIIYWIILYSYANFM